MGSLTRLLRANGGAAAIEFAVVASALIFVCLGVIEFGRGFHVRNELSFAADHAARKLLINPAVTDNALEEAVREAFIGSEPEGFSIEFSEIETDAGGLKSRTILIRYPFSFLIPTVSDSITLTVSRRVPIG